MSDDGSCELPLDMRDEQCRQLGTSTAAIETAIRKTRTCT